VRCYTPDGDLLGKIHIPETVANLCFGGQQRNRLYICGSTSLYAVYTGVQGAIEALINSTSWPGLARPPTFVIATEEESMDARHKAGQARASRADVTATAPTPHPLFRNPAEMPLIVI